MILTITGVCFVRNNQLLTVRKKNTAKYMLVGGKLEPGETALEAATREIWEEVGLTREEHQLTLLGTYNEEAANEPGWRVASTVYIADPLSDNEYTHLHAHAEIAEIKWLDLDTTPPASLAPLLAKHVVPALRNRSPIDTEG